jgi:hypothetical protein
MKAKHPTAKPALPTPQQHSGVKPERNTKKIQTCEERRLLLQVIEEAKAFCRADKRERHDGEK